MSNKKPSPHQYKILKMLSERSILMERNNHYTWDTHVARNHWPTVNKRTFGILVKNNWIKKGHVVHRGINEYTNYHITNEGLGIVFSPEPESKQRPLTNPQKDAMLAFNCGWWLRCINGRFYWDLEKKTNNPSLTEITNNYINKLMPVPRLSTLKRLLKDKFINAKYQIHLLTDGNIIKKSDYHEGDWKFKIASDNASKIGEIIEHAKSSTSPFSQMMNQSIKTHWALQDAGEIGTHNAEVFRDGINDEKQLDTNA